MKKVISLILVIAICLSLCACGKSKAATECENLINAIGEVSVDSGEAIEMAEKSYSALSTDEKDSISESAAVLNDARATYTFKLSKAAYQNIISAYDIVHEFGADLYNAWYLVGYKNEKLMNTNTVKVIASQVQYLNEEDIEQGLAFVLAKHKYGAIPLGESAKKAEWDALSAEDQKLYLDMAANYKGDDFFNQTNCLAITTWSVIYAYVMNGGAEVAQDYLNSAQSYMRELSQKYSDYEHYPNLKGFFTMAGAYLDVCRDSELSFTQFKDVINQYEKEARDYINDLDFIFGE